MVIAKVREGLMTDESLPGRTPLGEYDALSRFVEQVEHHLHDGNLPEVAKFLESDMAAAWYGFEPARTAEILQKIPTQLNSSTPILNAVMRLLTATSAGQFDDQGYLATVDSDDPHEMFVLSIFRMADLRLQADRLRHWSKLTTSKNTLGKCVCSSTHRMVQSSTPSYKLASQPCWRVTLRAH